jgi:hypothetical protein
MLGLYKTKDPDGSWWVTNGSFLWYSCKDEKNADFLLKDDIPEGAKNTEQANQPDSTQ